MPTNVRFLYDDRLRQETNGRSENYWYVYIREIADQLGMTAQQMSRQELASGALETTRVLIVPNLSEGYLATSERASLAEWVEGGGILIGFATEGLDELFGLRETGRIEQPGDAWSYSSALRLTDAELAAPLYSPEIVDAAIVIISAVRLVQAEGRELARLLAIDGTDLQAPAVTLRNVGQGKTCYFTFDLCQAMWTLHQGRPVYGDRDGDGYLRMSDAVVTRPFRVDVPYADLLLLLLRNVISLAGVSFISPLPPTADGQVPDALFYYGGDDEAAEGTQVFASDWMRAQGLPYHFNIMPHPDGSFAVSKEEFEQIKANGHEPSLHFNYIEGQEHPYPFTEADIRQQVEWYQEAFGETPICTVFHWTLWHLYHEPAQWMAACGVQADNSRIHTGSPPLNPANLCGYAFGTAFPFWYWSDWCSGNERVDFISEQITAYEVGYIGGQRADFPQLHRAIRDAAYWHFTMDFFYHPVNVTNRPECREAIVELQRYSQELDLTLVHMGNDEVNHWWRARSAARIEETDDGPSVTCDWPAGCILVTRAEDGVEELGGKWEYRVVRGE